MDTHPDISFNRNAHDKVAKRYEKIHTEIYNETEQTRLKKALKEAVDSIDSVKRFPKVLDVGCGAGNLTDHLVDLESEVTASDISEKFLSLVRSKHPQVKTHVLNGEDLREIPDTTFDMVVTYSVLHHIPDYLKMVEEMCRVLKPGGVLYIDHEKNELNWNNDPTLVEFYHKQRYADVPIKIVRKLKNYTNPQWYIGKYRRLKNPRYQEEGDIHVWPDDHVEWDKVKSVASSCGLDVFSETNFLHFNSKYNLEIYNQYKDVTSDMKAVIFKKVS